jgi:hypothetical protein
VATTEQDARGGATIAELIGYAVEEPPPPETFECPRCGGPVPVDAEWQPLPAPPGRLRAFKSAHERADGGACVLYAGGPLPQGGQER